MKSQNQWPQWLGVTSIALLLGAAPLKAQMHSSDTSGQDSKMSSSTTKTTTTNTTTHAGAMGQTKSSSVSKDDAKFFENIAQANMAEIETGKLALEKSQNDQVKTFAQKMIDDHTKALNELQTLAQSKSVTLPTEPDVAHRTMLTGMKALSGETFDKQYMMHAGVGDHKRTHELLQKVQKEATDADLRAYVQKIMPAVDAHWDMAKDLRAKQK